jgi:hypothetical protein
VNLTPHKLVGDLALGLAEKQPTGALKDALDDQAAAVKAHEDAKAAVDQATTAVAGATQAEKRKHQADLTKKERALEQKTAALIKRTNLVDVLAKDGDVPELSAFSGYLGGAITGPASDDTQWRVLYLDAKLVTWLLIRTNDILNRKSVDDETAPYGKRDVVWLRRDAAVLSGSGAQAVAERFLRGAFTSAGDFATAIVGGTFTAASGIFCDAPTPNCCPAATRTPACH